MKSLEFYESLKTIIPLPLYLKYEDLNSEDQIFLNIIKSTPNSVRFPSHWKSKKGLLKNRKFYNILLIFKLFFDLKISKSEREREREKKGATPDYIIISKETEICLNGYINFK